jgi:hypothetical protein
MTAREALIGRLKTYEEEVSSGRHVPPAPQQKDQRPSPESQPED